MPKPLPPSPTPKNFADAAVEHSVDPAARILAGKDGRLTRSEVRKAAELDGGALTAAVDNLEHFFKTHRTEKPSVETVIRSAHRSAEVSARAAAGDDGRLSRADAEKLPDRWIDNYVALRGHGTTSPEPATKGTVHTTFKGTWLLNLDTGVQSDGGDLWWEQMDNVRRALVPQAGVQIARLGAVDFESLSLEDLRALTYTSDKIDGSKNAGNQLKAGTVLAVRTDEGRYSKLIIDEYGYDLDVRFVTYGQDGKPRHIVPTLKEPEPAPVTPRAPPPPPPQLVHPVTDWSERTLPAGTSAALQAAGDAGSNRWSAIRVAIPPERLAAIDTDPSLAGALAFEMAFPELHGNEGYEVAEATPIASADVARALAERVPGWEDWSEAEREEVTRAAAGPLAKLFPAGFLDDPAVRLRATGWGDEDATMNVAGVVAWNVETGEARGLFAHKIW